MSEAERAFERWSEESGTIPACNLERDAFLAGYAAGKAETIYQELFGPSRPESTVEGAKGGESDE
ncbi:MAG TPA: hypothetical protein VFO09_05505 [Methyloceanibacter sp.]|nr:hypothetical protein [Methyloceanibacter sp.]